MSILASLLSIALGAVIVKKAHKMGKRSHCKQARDMRKIQKLEKWLDTLKSRAGVAPTVDAGHQAWCTGACGGQCTPEMTHQEWCKGNCGGQCALRATEQQQQQQQGQYPKYPVAEGESDDDAKAEKRRLQAMYQEVSEPPTYVKM